MNITTEKSGAGSTAGDERISTMLTFLGTQGRHGRSQTRSLAFRGEAGWAGCWVLALALIMGVSPLAGQPARASTRYLVIVDTSRSMRHRSKAMLRTVQDLLNSGMQGELSGGETLGLWTFNEDLYTGRLPLQVWAPQEQEAIVRRTLSFLKAQACQRQPNLEKVIPALQDVVKDSELITVILISAGAAKMRGTPFDDLINDYYARWNNEQPNGQVPLVTVFRARNGKMIRCSVRPASERVEFPPLPPPEAPVVRTEAPAPVPAPQNVPPQMAPPLILSGKKLRPETTQSQKTEAPVVRAERPAPVPPGPVPAPQNVPPQMAPPLILSGKKLRPETTQSQKTEAPVVRAERPAPVPPGPVPAPQNVPPQMAPPLILSGGKLRPETVQPQKTEAPVVKVEPPLAEVGAAEESVSSPASASEPAFALFDTSNPPETGACASVAAPSASASVSALKPPDSSLAPSEPSTPAPTPSAHLARMAQPASVSHARPMRLWAGGILAGSCCLAFGLFRLRCAREATRLSLITCSLDGGGNKPPSPALLRREKGD